MRTLLLTIAVVLMGFATANAHWPITYVGNPGIHRFDGNVRQVTLAQPHVEQSTMREGERLDRGELDAEPAVPLPTASEREFEIRRYGRRAQQATLVTSADERLSELLRSSAPNAEYVIEVGNFLREPKPAEELFTNNEWFAPELERPLHHGRIDFGGVVIGR